MVEREEIILRVKKAIGNFYKNDKELLQYNTKDTTICERSISFRIGIYLQQLFKGYNVDAEYNRNIERIKRLDGKNIYPDIIIHKRKTNDNNLLWIEIKKENSTEESKESDRERLKKVTKEELEYKYKLGILIILTTNEQDTILEIYENGEHKNIENC